MYNFIYYIYISYDVWLCVCEGVKVMCGCVFVIVIRLDS